MNGIKKLETSKKAADITSVANDDWPMLSEMSQKSFLIKGKKINPDIEKTSESIQKSSVVEDKRISKQNQKDDTLIKNLDKGDIKGKSIVDDENLTMAPNLNEEKEMQHVTATAPVVEPQTKPTVTAAPNKAIEKTSTVSNPNKNRSTINVDVEQIKSNVTLMKQVGLGLGHLFIINATTLLNPMSFVLQNFKKISTAAIHILIPLLMTLYLMNKVEFIATQLNKETMGMYILYSVIFYLACSFMWLTAQISAKGLLIFLKAVGIVFKKLMQDVAKFGQK